MHASKSCDLARFSPLASGGAFFGASAITRPSSRSSSSKIAAAAADVSAAFTVGLQSPVATSPPTRTSAIKRGSWSRLAASRETRYVGVSPRFWQSSLRMDFAVLVTVPSHMDGAASRCAGCSDTRGRHGSLFSSPRAVWSEARVSAGRARALRRGADEIVARSSELAGEIASATAVLLLRACDSDAGRADGLLALAPTPALATSAASFKLARAPATMPRTRRIHSSAAAKEPGLPTALGLTHAPRTVDLAQRPDDSHLWLKTQLIDGSWLGLLALVVTRSSAAPRSSPRSASPRRAPRGVRASRSCSTERCSTSDSWPTASRNRSGARCPSGPSRSSSRRPPRRWYRTARAQSSDSSTSRRRRSHSPLALDLRALLRAARTPRRLLPRAAPPDPPLSPLVDLHKVHHEPTKSRSPCTPSTSICPI